MANPEHLDILKQGVEAWNGWRSEHREVVPDLSHARLRCINLRGADLRDAQIDFADLRGADLCGANLNRTVLFAARLNEASLNGAQLFRAHLKEAILRRAELTRALLIDADLSSLSLVDADLEGAVIGGSQVKRANLSRANLKRATLADVNIKLTNLTGARLCGARLRGTYLDGVNLEGADFTDASLEYVRFADTDLSRANGLETVSHGGPSSIGIDTIYKFRGKIPEVFLRGCGLSNWQIQSAKLYRPDLSNEELTDILYRVHDLRAHQAIQISPLFISYSHVDGSFVDEIEKYLDWKGVRFWRDVRHSTAGRLETQIDRAIRLNPTVLLVLSEQSVRSDWVEHEARLARKLEVETGRDVLCPVALDDSWKTCRWPERLREQIMEYNVLDFSNWQDPDYMRQMFTRLIDGLDLFYK